MFWFHSYIVLRRVSFCPIQRRNSWNYDFVEVSGHNWDFSDLRFLPSFFAFLQKAIHEQTWVFFRTSPFLPWFVTPAANNTVPGGQGHWCLLMICHTINCCRYIFLYIFLVSWSVLAIPLLMSPILYFWLMSGFEPRELPEKAGMLYLPNHSSPCWRYSMAFFK